MSYDSSANAVTIVGTHHTKPIVSDPSGLNGNARTSVGFLATAMGQYQSLTGPRFGILLTPVNDGQYKEV